MEYATSLDESQVAELGTLIEESLGVLPEVWPKLATRIGVERLRALYDGEHLAAACGFLDFGHWFGGRRVGAIGVTVVAVPAEDRGRGCAYSIMAKLLAESRDAGYPLATLYASTQTLYRRLGFEQAGSFHLHEVELRHLPATKPELELRRVSHEAMREEFPPLYARYARSQEGMVDRPAGLWERLVDPRQKSRCFALGPRGAAEGYVILAQKDVKSPDPRAQHKPFRFAMLDRVANTPAAWQSMLTLLASHRSVVDTVRWWGPANEPLRLLLAEQDVRTVHDERWMLRVLDVERAFAQRGYASGLNVQLSLAVEDELLPQNSGAYELRIEAGNAHVQRVENGEIRVARVEALGPLYSGLIGARQLAAFGWLEGSEDALARAELAFVGSEPWMIDHF